MTRSAPGDMCHVEAPGQSWWHNYSFATGHRTTHEHLIENNQDRPNSWWDRATKTSSLDADPEYIATSGSAERRNS